MNWDLKNNDKVNALVVTAHPDDETIFCGGTILSYPNWKWNIISVTMQTNTVRPQEFAAAMSLYKHFGVNLHSYLTLLKRDENQDLSPLEIEDWRDSLNYIRTTPDIIFTHNLQGEYGHKHHIILNKIVHEVFSGQNIWDFVYPGDTEISPQPIKDKLNKVDISRENLEKKENIFNTAYVTQKGCWNDLKNLMAYEFNSGPEIFTK